MSFLPDLYYSCQLLLRSLLLKCLQQPPTFCLNALGLLLLWYNFILAVVIYRLVIFQKSLSIFGRNSLLHKIGTYGHRIWYFARWEFLYSRYMQVQRLMLLVSLHTLRIIQVLSWLLLGWPRKVNLALKKQTDENYICCNSPLPCPVLPSFLYLSTALLPFLSVVIPWYCPLLAWEGLLLVVVVVVAVDFFL